MAETSATMFRYAKNTHITITFQFILCPFLLASIATVSTHFGARRGQRGPPVARYTLYGTTIRPYLSGVLIYSNTMIAYEVGIWTDEGHA